MTVYSTVLAIAGVLAATLVPARAQGADESGPQRGYSMAPLRDPVFDAAKVVLETAAFNNWLGANIQTLTYEQMKGPREHLYYLIDSRVKQLYAEEKRVLPRGHDPILAMLFSWSEHLGVFGGAYAYNAVKAPESRAMQPAMAMPHGITLGLEGDLFRVESDLGWSVRFPYYFMLWNVADFTTTNGARTQLLILSTGATKDKSQLGHSQATLMFLCSPESEIDDFRAYWREQLGVRDGAKLESLDNTGLQSQHVVDESMKLHKEFTAWSAASRSYGVVYSGIEGTYEWNRVHFVDFVRSIETKGGQAAEMSFRSTELAPRGVPPNLRIERTGRYAGPEDERSVAGRSSAGR